jgi:flagella basal body P-ring formation protein FlgA
MKRARQQIKAGARASCLTPRASRLSFFSAFLLSALLGGGPRVIAFPGAAAFDLLPAAQVDSAGIFLPQIVAASQSVPPPQPIRLADAPAFGQAASFSRAQVAEMLKVAMPGLLVTNWSGAAQVRVTRRAHALNERELRDLLIATLQRDFVKDKGDLELRFSRPWAPVLVPDETLELKIIDLPATGVGANFITRFELLTGKDRLGPWQVVAQAKVMKEVLVARTTLKPRQSLQAPDFIVERRDVLSLREALDETALKIPSLELVESVQPGQPLLARNVRMKPVVQRGQFVDGLVRDGALNIALKVEVLADGLPGQTVRVRNPKTKREFYAKVQDEQTVVINL